MRLLAGSVTAYTAYIWLLDRVPGSLVSTYTFITPIIAMFLGWTFLGERLSAQMLFGTMLVIGSVILVWCLETESGVPNMSIPQKKGRSGANAAAKEPRRSPVTAKMPRSQEMRRT